jgi:hypothetical protein
MSEHNYQKHYNDLKCDKCGLMKLLTRNASTEFSPNNNSVFFAFGCDEPWNDILMQYHDQYDYEPTCDEIIIKGIIE